VLYTAGLMDPASRIGSVLAGKYKLEGLLGTGGMGAVYEALHLGVQKRFAIKVLRPEAFADEASRSRFTKEAQAAAKIEHPNVVSVFDVGETEDSAPFMVMEILRGRSLFDALDGGAFEVTRAVHVACEMLSALDCAHRVGIVHRDVKPANVFLVDEPDGSTSVKVLDFGVAKFTDASDEASLTQSGAIVGTPLYMAPEQFLADREVDGRADVWAVGATLFQMLTDRPVHLTTSATAAAAKVVSEPAPLVRSIRPDVDEELSNIVAKALSIQRNLRFASAREMKEALERHSIGAGETVPGTLSTPPRASSPEPSRGSMPSAHTDGGTRAVTTSNNPDAPKQGPSLGKHALLGLASGVLGALVTVALVLRSSNEPPVSNPSALPPLPTVPDVYRPHEEPREAEALPVQPSASVAPPVTGKPIGPTTTTSPTGPASGKPKPNCEDGQVLSNGHCCAKGLVWQGERCERPLATDF
jgi:serine/threonine protein kinase